MTTKDKILVLKKLEEMIEILTYIMVSQDDFLK